MQTREERNRRRRAWHVKNIDRVKAKKKKYRVANRDRVIAQNKNYRDANREKIRARTNSSYAANHEKRRAKANRWRAANREKTRADAKASYNANRDKESARKKAYRAANREKVEAKERCKDAKRRALKADAPVGDIEAIINWERKWKRLKRVTCHWCRQPFSPKKCHTDHVIPLSKSGAHSLDNLVVSCAFCNLSKNAKLPDVWNRQLAEPVLWLPVSITESEQIAASLEEARLNGGIT